jgi:hypothetical protein
MWGGGESVGDGGFVLKGAAGDNRERGVRQRGRHAVRGSVGPGSDRVLAPPRRADAADAQAPAGGWRGSEERGEPRGIVVISNYSKSISNEFKQF